MIWDLDFRWGQILYRYRPAEFYFKFLCSPLYLFYGHSREMRTSLSKLLLNRKCISREQSSCCGRVSDIRTNFSRRNSVRLLHWLICGQAVCRVVVQSHMTQVRIRLDPIRRQCYRVTSVAAHFIRRSRFNFDVIHKSIKVRVKDELINKILSLLLNLITSQQYYFSKIAKDNGISMMKKVYRKSLINFNSRIYLKNFTLNLISL